MADDVAQIWLVTEVESTEVVEVPEEVTRGGRSGEDVGGSFGPSRKTERVTTIVRQKRVPLDAVALRAQMHGLLQVVGDVFDHAAQQRGLQLDEVELSVEINAEGQVSIMGNGGKLADKGGIKLKFKRG